MPSHEVHHTIVLFDMGKRVYVQPLPYPLPRDKAMAFLLASTTDPFWDEYEKIYGVSAEQANKDGFTACVRAGNGILYAVPTHMLVSFMKERTNEVEKDV